MHLGPLDISLTVMYWKSFSASRSINASSSFTAVLKYLLSERPLARLLLCPAAAVENHIDRRNHQCTDASASDCIHLPPKAAAIFSELADHGGL